MQNQQEKLINDFNQRIPIPGIHTILTHHFCHLDEFGGMYLLQTTNEGKQLFPGIEDAGCGFVSETYLRNNGFIGFKGFIKALEKGYLIIGLGGGPFDKHNDREKRISTIELVKRHLNLFAEKTNRTLYGNLIYFINFEDNHGDNLISNLNKADVRQQQEDLYQNLQKNNINTTDEQIRLTVEQTAFTPRKLNDEQAAAMQQLNLGMIAQNIKKGWEIAESIEDQQRLVKMVYCFFKHEVTQRRKFLEAVDEYNSSQKKIVDIGMGFGLVLVKSDKRQITQAVRSIKTLPGNKKLGVTFIQRSNGQFVFYPEKRFEGEMIEVVKILRQTITRNRQNKNLPFDILGMYGKIDAVPELYIDENMKIIMNGSKTDPDAPGLIGNGISVDEIIEAVVIGLNPRRFDSRHEKKCAQGVCSKMASTPCSLFSLGLARCAEIREKMTSTTVV